MTAGRCDSALIVSIFLYSSIDNCSRRLLKFFKKRKRIFKIPNTPSMSLRTDSRFFDQRISRLLGIPFLDENIRHGQA
jgi:hypothetical protein